MPNYDYICESCGHEFEVFQSMKDPKLTDCPQSGCCGPVRRRLGTGAGVIFKGSGFYETDYRSASYKEGAKQEKNATKPAESTGSAGEGAKSKEPKSSASDPAKAKPASSGTAA
jgi:putative FmdB family regulatory protein